MKQKVTLISCEKWEMMKNVVFFQFLTNLPL